MKKFITLFTYIIFIYVLIISVATVTYAFFPKFITTMSGDKEGIFVMLFILVLLPIYKLLRDTLIELKSITKFNNGCVDYGEIIIKEVETRKDDMFKLASVIWLHVFAEMKYNMYRDNYKRSFSFMIAFNYARINRIIEKEIVDIVEVNYKTDKISKEELFSKTLSKLKEQNDFIYQILEREMVKKGDLIKGEET